MMSHKPLGMVVVAAAVAAVAGFATSQPQPSSPVAATQVDLPRSRTDSAALGQARQDPLAARLRGVLGQDPATAAVLQAAEASSVPVLGPADPALLRTARIYTGDRHYMMVVQRGDQIIEIYGTAKAFQSPTARPAPQGTPGRRPGLTAGPAALPVPGLAQQAPGAAPPTTARQVPATRPANVAAARARAVAPACPITNGGGDAVVREPAHAINRMAASGAMRYGTEGGTVTGGSVVTRTRAHAHEASRYAAKLLRTRRRTPATNDAGCVSVPPTTSWRGHDVVAHRLRPPRTPRDRA